MWLRDSSAQVFPYLQLAAGDEPLQQMLRGLIARQSRCIIKDPYANAFNKEDNGRGHQDDMTRMGPGIWERKWEIDSLCYPVRLDYHYWKTTGDSGVFTPEWDQAMRTVYRTFREQQRPGGNRDSAYRFQRTSPVACETVMLGIRESHKALRAYLLVVQTFGRCHYPAVPHSFQYVCRSESPADG